MSDSCPTVRTVADNEQGFVVRNASDFDPEVHTLYKEPEPAPAEPAPAEPAPAEPAPAEPAPAEPAPAARPKAKKGE